MLILWSSFLLIKSFLYRGFILKGPDDKLRNCYPVLFSVAMDYPEACLFALVRAGSSYPVCTANKEDFNDLLQTFDFRDSCMMSEAVELARNGNPTSLNKLNLLEEQVSNVTIEYSCSDDSLNMYFIY